MRPMYVLYWIGNEGEETFIDASFFFTGNALFLYVTPMLAIQFICSSLAACLCITSAMR